MLILSDFKYVQNELPKALSPSRFKCRFDLFSNDFPMQLLLINV